MYSPYKMYKYKVAVSNKLNVLFLFNRDLNETTCNLTIHNIEKLAEIESKLINRREALEKDLLKLESELADLKAHGIEK